MNNKFAKDHYKLYKSGKLWVAALVTATVLGGAAVTTTAHAAENTAATTNTEVVNQAVTGVTTSADQSSANEQVTVPAQPKVAGNQSSQAETGQIATQGGSQEASSEALPAIDTDQQLQDLLTENTDLAKQLLGRAAIFHIFFKGNHDQCGYQWEHCNWQLSKGARIRDSWRLTKPDQEGSLLS